MKYSYRIAARTEAAGKYNPTAPNEGNEDSLAILPDVGNPDAALSSDTVLPLPDKGVLMVVADGMGGHNAGEVASQIAVATVRQMFDTEKIADKNFDSPKSRADYLEEVVKAADKNICDDAAVNPDRQGMGSTIVMAWIVDNEVTVTWCGDSRAYLYRPGEKLEMLSEDHSLVQDLVRKKNLEYADTFAHPQGNVITRCLGGGSKSNAKPESRQFSIEPGDLIMLCSDGLSGVLFDYYKEKEDGSLVSQENLQDILSRHKDYLQDIIACLFDAARRCDWYDNVTAILFELQPYNGNSIKVVANSSQSNESSSKKENKDIEKKNHRGSFLTKKYPFWYFFVALALIIIIFLCLLIPRNDDHGFTDSIVNETMAEDNIPQNHDSMETAGQAQKIIINNKPIQNQVTTQTSGSQPSNVDTTKSTEEGDNGDLTQIPS